MSRHQLSSFRRRARQRGIVLIVALIVMVATILAAVALISSVDVATLISGNLAFRQSGVQAADAGVEAAMKWMMAPPADKLYVLTGNSYFPSWNADPKKPFEPKTFDWASHSTALATDAAGNTVAYVIHRMCDGTGNPNDVDINARPHCYNAESTATEGNSNAAYRALPCTIGTVEYCGAEINPYYRITIKVTGPRNTVTYVQAVTY